MNITQYCSIFWCTEAALRSLIINIIMLPYRTVVSLFKKDIMSYFIKTGKIHHITVSDGVDIDVEVYIDKYGYLIPESVIEIFVKRKNNENSKNKFYMIFNNAATDNVILDMFLKTSFYKIDNNTIDKLFVDYEKFSPTVFIKMNIVYNVQTFLIGIWSMITGRDKFFMGVNFRYRSLMVNKSITIEDIENFLRALEKKNYFLYTDAKGLLNPKQ